MLIMVSTGLAISPDTCARRSTGSRFMRYSSRYAKGCSGRFESDTYVVEHVRIHKAKPESYSRMYGKVQPVRMKNS